MFGSKQWFLLLLPALLVLGACGGGGDDDDDDDSGDSGGVAGSNSGNRARNSDGADLKEIKDGVFDKGKVRLEVSGDKDFEIEVDGGGIVNGGFALLTFGSTDATVLLSFQPGSEGEPGAFSLTSKELVAGGEWGPDCDVSYEDGSTELKGEFECDNIEGIEGTTTKSYDVKVKGTFSVTRAR